MADPPRSSTARLVATSASFAVVAATASWAFDRGPLGARAGGALASAGLGLASGVLLAAVAVAARVALVRAIGPARVARLVDLRAAFARDAPARGPIVAVHTLATSALLGVVVVGVATKLALLRLRTVQDPALAEALASVVVVVVTLAAVGVAALAWSWLARRWGALDARRPLPLPASAPARAILFGGLPLALVGGLGLAALGRALGPFSIPFACLAALGLANAASAPFAAVAPPRRGRTLALAAGLAIAGLGLADRVLASWAGAPAAAEASPLGQGLLRAARAATDVDRDGTSSLFGGRDCAAFDRNRRPGEHDVPGNGVDEDCSGADADADAAMPTGPRFWGERKVEGRPPDIVWFVVDAVRADHVGFLGYRRETTPRLDELAKESLVFSRAWSQSSATMLSFPSFLTGIDPGRLTWRIQRERLQVGPNQPYISTRLEALGYRTGFVAADYFAHRLPGLTEGWGWMHVSDKAQTKSSASAAAHASTFVAESLQHDQPFFLVVYMAGPHSPYVTHGDGYPDFGDRPVDKYDQEIVNADRNIGFVLDMLRMDAQRWKNTVVVFDSDHGEEFGEHGGTDHARTCHAESVHVPLLVRIPGETAARIDRPVALIDVAPTLLEIAGGTARADELDGHSLLLSARAPDRLPEERPFFCSVVSQKATQGSFFQRAVRSGRWVAMQELRSGQAVKLFDAEADPGEQKPVAADGEAAVASRRLASYLSRQLTSNLGEMPLGDDP